MFFFCLFFLQILDKILKKNKKLELKNYNKKHTEPIVFIYMFEFGKIM